MSEVTESQRSGRAEFRLIFGFICAAASGVVAGVEFHSPGIGLTVLMGLWAIMCGFHALSAAFETD